MDEGTIRLLLEQTASGALSVEDALLKLKMAPYEDLGFAKPDHHRALRQGATEVIYGESKTAEQIQKIAQNLLEHGQRTVLITRLSDEKAQQLEKSLSFDYRKEARLGIVGSMPAAISRGYILVATGGTSDIPVAEEAAITAEVFGNRVRRLYDVGVAGLHRLLAHTEEIMRAKVIVAVAGMEGALASVMAGIAACPVIAVPTSVGYGASFGGISALLSMLNSCAGGVSVVNIDNGFGAGFLAARINRIGE